MRLCVSIGQLPAGAAALRAVRRHADAFEHRRPERRAAGGHAIPDARGVLRGPVQLLPEHHPQRLLHSVQRDPGRSPLALLPGQREGVPCVALPRALLSLLPDSLLHTLRTGVHLLLAFVQYARLYSLVQFAFEGMLLAVYKDRQDLTCPSLTTASPASAAVGAGAAVAVDIGRMKSCPSPDQILQYLEVDSSYLSNVFFRLRA